MTLSATDLAIALAYRADALKTTERTGRFGQYWAIEDAAGVIEVHNTDGEAFRRITDVMRRAG